MFKKISLIALGIIVGLLIAAAMKPDEFHVERSISIKAPPERIFPLINDLQAFVRWSPYEQLDPAMQRSFSGAPGGKGAVYSWQGNDKVGSGRMEIISATAPRNVVIQLDFMQPFEAHNTAAFTLTPEGEGTTVTWAMLGPAPFISKVMSIFFSIDAIVGKDFEAGLINLRKIAETP